MTFRVRYSERTAQPTHRLIMGESPVSRVELLMWGPMANLTTLSWFDAAPDAVAAVLDSVEYTDAYHLVPDDDGTYAFVTRSSYEFDESLVDLVSRSRVAFLPPVAFHDTGEARFEAAGDRTRLGEFYAALSDRLDATIQRVREFRRRPSGTVLTDRQRAALAAAADAGYYDVPRSGSVRDVADRLDCASSTAGELLRRAESALVSAHLDPD